MGYIGIFWDMRMKQNVYSYNSNSCLPKNDVLSQKSPSIRFDPKLQICIGSYDMEVYNSQVGFVTKVKGEKSVIGGMAVLGDLFILTEPRLS